MPIKFPNQRLGFTLIELMVVVSIIGVLSVVGITIYSSAQVKARDSVRKNSLKQIQSAIELYSQTHGSYPIGTDDSSCIPIDNTFNQQIGNYLRQIPQDPKTKGYYCYTGDYEGTKYRLIAALENQNDSQIDSTIQSSCQTDKTKCLTTLANDGSPIALAVVTPTLIISQATAAASSPDVSATILCENYGDLNRDGKITSADKQILLQSVADNSQDDAIKAIGDINGDQEISSLDAQLLDRYLAGIDSTFSVCTNTKLPICNNLGDVTGDGKVTSMDVAEVLGVYLGDNSIYTNKPFTDEQKRRADVTGDGQVDNSDILPILRYVKGEITVFAACSKPLLCENYGDLNRDGKITVDDITIMKQGVADNTGNPEIRVIGDVNGDQNLTSLDFTLVSRYLIGMDSNFSVCTDAKNSPCSEMGDITGDGKVTFMDAAEAIRMDGNNPSIYTRQPFTAEQKRRGDVDKDSAVTTDDGLLILQFVSGRNSTFPACQ